MRAAAFSFRHLPGAQRDGRGQVTRFYLFNLTFAIEDEPGHGLEALDSLNDVITQAGASITDVYPPDVSRNLRVRSEWTYLLNTLSASVDIVGIELSSSPMRAWTPP